jgi:hypothetical protein
MGIDFVPIQEASDSLIEECLRSVLDSLPENSPVTERMWARVQAIREGHYPAACDMLLKDWQGVGWSGWFPLWSNPYDTWSSTTYLAPQLRGKGLFPVLRCRQAHAANEIVKRLGEKVGFVSSIETTNIQSLRASHKYAQQNKWENRWYLVEDKENDRLLLRMHWPTPPKIKHECFLGQELKMFEEIISKLDVEFAHESQENDLKLTIDTWVRNHAKKSLE